MNVFSGFFNGLREIWAHKVRSLLTMLGIILGVASLVAMMGIVRGMMSGWRNWIVESGGIEKLGVAAEEPPEEQQSIAGRSPGRTLTDADAIARACPLAALVSPEQQMWRPQVQVGGKVVRPLQIMGFTPAGFPMNAYEVVRGRPMAESDLAGFAQVAWIGSGPRTELFGAGADALGRRVRIFDVPFEIVGELKHYELPAPPGRSRGRNPLDHKNQTLIIPLTTMQQRLTGNPQLGSLNIKVRDAAQLDALAEQVENTLLQTHRGIRDFRIQTQEEMMAQFADFERSLMTSLGGVAAISLLVGGIGIMNVMLATINERIREIGIRKAVGARDHDIFLQFVAEAVTLSMLGGLLGLGVAVGLVRLLALTMARVGAPELSLQALVVGFSFSVGIGMVFGIYPAFRASRLDPIEALRYE